MKKNQILQNLNQFVHHDDVPAYVIKKELESKGVDVDSFLQRVNETVRKANQQRIVEVAREEQEEASYKANKINVWSMTLDAIKKLLSQGANGDFGNCGKELVLAHRNHDGEQSEEELRSLARDLLILSGEPCEKDARNS